MAALAAILLPSSMPAQITFQRTYGGPGADEGWSVEQTLDGGYIVAGDTDCYGLGHADVYLLKTDDRGVPQWTKIYGGNDDDGGLSVRQTTDGGYIVAGYTYSYGAGEDDVYLIRTDAGGNALWTKTFGGTYADAGTSVQQTTDSGFIVAGFTTSFGAEWENAYLIKTNALGDTQWTRMFAGMNWDGTTVQQTADSGFIVAGHTDNACLIKTDAAGDSQWTRVFGGRRDSYGQSVRQTTDYGFIVTGEGISDSGDLDAYLIKTDALGDTQWTRTYGGPADDLGRSVRQTADGGFIFAGSTRSFGAGCSDVYLVKTDANGAAVWARTFGGANYDWSHSAQQTSDGGYIVSGTTLSFGAGSANIYLIKTDSLGNVAVTEPKVSPTRAPALSLTCEPNPCRGATRIGLKPQASSSKPLTLNVYDAGGRDVRTLTVNRTPCTVWDGKDELGQPLPSGTYFLRLDAGSQHATTRLVLQR
jgi:hypothetical protein